MSPASQIREAGPGDAQAIAEIHVRSWLATYRGMLPDAILDSLSVEQREEAWRSRLVEPAGGGFVLVAADPEVAGFLSANVPSHDLDSRESVGEIAALYIHPEAVGLGHGHALVEDALLRFRQAGCTEATVWTLGVNTGARAFYERLDFTLDDATRSDRSAGVPEVRYRLRLA